jgi:hypothetical protein
LRSALILFEQIYSNLATCISTLRSAFCIFSQILDALCALRLAPNFYEIHPWLGFEEKPKVSYCLACGAIHELRNKILEDF